MNTKFSDYPSYILDAWFLFASFRCLGFQSADIFALVTKNAEDGNLWFGMLLKTQEKEFLAFVVPVADGDAVLNDWRSFATRLVEGQFEMGDIQSEWRNRLSQHGGEELVTKLLMKGFNLPIATN